MHKSNNTFYILCGLLLLCIVFWRRFLPGYIYTGDTGFISHFNLNSVYNSFVWLGSRNLGHSLAELPRIIINGFVGLLSSLGWEWNGSIIRLFFLLPYCFFGFLGTYRLASFHINNKFLCLLAGLLYVINTPVIGSLSMGHLHQIVPLGLFPWILLYLEKYTSSGYDIDTILKIIVLLFISSIYEFRFAYIAFLVVFLYLIYNVFHKKASSKKILIASILLLFGFLLMNAYWIIPFLHIGPGDIEKLVSRGPFGNGYWDILNGIGQFHSYWNGGDIEIFVKQHIPLYFFILGIIAILGLFKRPTKSILFYYIVLLLGILLVKQAGIPFPNLYNWLYNNVPGFNMFREGSRFFQLISLSYAIIIPYVLGLYSYNSKLKLYYYIGVGGVIFYLCMIMVPIFFGVNKTLFQPKYPDQEYDSINNFIEKQSDFFRILYIPGISNFMIYNDAHHGISYIDIVNQMPSLPHYSKASSIIDTPGFDSFIDSIGVKYIIVDKSIAGKDDPFYRYEPRYDYEKYIIKKYTITKIPVPGSNTISVFENTGYNLLINASVAVEYKFVSPTKYHISLTIPMNKTGIHLSFLQSFHPERKLYPDGGSGGIRESLRYLQAQPLRDREHTKIYDYANGWKIDLHQMVSKETKGEKLTYLEKGLQEGRIHKVPYGEGEEAYQLKLMLYFRPQSWLYVGFLISGTTMLGILLWSIRVRVKKRKEKL